MNCVNISTLLHNFNNLIEDDEISSYTLNIFINTWQKAKRIISIHLFHTIWGILLGGILLISIHSFSARMVYPWYVCVCADDIIFWEQGEVVRFYNKQPDELESFRRTVIKNIRRRELCRLKCRWYRIIILYLSWGNPPL